MRRPRNESKRRIKFRTFRLSHPLIPYKTLSGGLLTKDAVRVLICCVYDIDDAFYFGYESQTNHLDAYLGENKCRNPMGHAEMYHAVAYLQRLGLVENLHGKIDDFYFTTTYEGIHFFHLRRKNFISLFFNSILLPILVSIITTLVVIAVSG